MAQQPQAHPHARASADQLISTADANSLHVELKECIAFINDVSLTSQQQHVLGEKQERVDKQLALKNDYAQYPHRNPALNARIDHDLEQLKAERDAATVELERLRVKSSTSFKHFLDKITHRVDSALTSQHASQSLLTTRVNDLHAHLTTRMDDLVGATDARARDTEGRFREVETWLREADARLAGEATAWRQEMREEAKNTLQIATEAVGKEVKALEKKHGDEAKVLAGKLDKQMLDLKETARQAMIEGQRETAKRAEEQVTKLAEEVKTVRTMVEKAPGKMDLLQWDKRVTGLQAEMEKARTDRAEIVRIRGDVEGWAGRMAGLETQVVNLDQKLEERARTVMMADGGVLGKRVAQEVEEGLVKRVRKQIEQEVEEGLVKRVRKQMEEEEGKKNSSKEVARELGTEEMAELRSKLEEQVKLIGEIQGLLAPAKKSVLKVGFAEKIMNGFETYRIHLADTNEMVEAIKSDMDALKSQLANLPPPTVPLVPEQLPPPATPTNSTPAITPLAPDPRIAQLEQTVEILRHELETLRTREESFQREAEKRDKEHEKHVDSIKNMVETVTQYIASRLPPPPAWSPNGGGGGQVVNGKVTDAVVGK
ncbi:hypothetical protein BC937DRAFT_90188 [Endogone sp. FLAS-F59071]|nr:hypothetical protein BC937DRAFT_90188 [Endogone sp. FLAS-F59071]|eukprot:RUS23241.1 hypothetical protein BC937DRAFT_90188 [Endogone sp. FLAS-F59071]